MEDEKIVQVLGEMEETYVKEARTPKKEKKIRWKRWGVVVATIGLFCLGGFSLFSTIKHPSQPSTALPETLQPEPSLYVEEDFVAVSSLLASNNTSSEETVLQEAKVSIETYIGVYEKVGSVESDVLSQSIGAIVSGTEQWYYILGHKDLQYLIQKEDGVYSLWKFMYFDSEEYPYKEVLEKVYQITSADQISKIEVNPAAMDNTDTGKALQEEIGSYTITKREEIEALYQVLSSLVCYGEGNWDKIDYGNAEVAVDEEVSLKEEVWLGRYLTIVTSYGNEIDGLKYTAVSDMFYEFYGIAYQPLEQEQADRVGEILRIEKVSLVKTCKEYLEKYDSEVIETVTNWDNPSVTIIEKLPEDYYKIAEDIHSEKYFKVVFTTTSDALLGTIDFFLDEDGNIIGANYRE